MNKIKIWITWHRQQSFKNIDIIKQKLYLFLDNFIIDNKLNKNDIIFNLWGANWIDNWVWEYCINNNIEFDLYLPFSNKSKQINDWNKEQVELYKKIIKHASKINYWNWYFDRNRKIVDNADILIAWLLKWKENSWTWYTYKYAISKNKKTYNIFD